MEKLHIKEIAAATSGELIIPVGLTDDFYIENINTDTREIAEGDLFLALEGENFDGHNYTELAVKKGASALILSHGFQSGEVPVIKVRDTLKALQDIAHYYRMKFSVPIIAVTGSNGKTTTKDMISNVLSNKYNVYATAKNFNNQIGLPKTILGMNKEHQIAVFELGMNHASEIEFLSKISEPDLAVITNVGTAHIEHLKSRENIYKAKMEILAGLKPNGGLVINADDDYLSLLNENSEELSGFSLVRTGINSGSDIMAYDISPDDTRVSFTVDYKDESARFTLPVMGTHNVSNALIAIACGVLFGVTLDEMSRSLSQYIPTSLRSEIFYLNSIAIIKDYYNSSPESVRASLKTLSEFNSKGKKYVILGEMLELGEFADELHENIGELCHDYHFEATFFVGDSFDAVKKGCKENVFSYKTKGELLSKLERFVWDNNISENDTVLIKGSRGMRMEEVFEQLKKYITDRKIGAQRKLPESSVSLHVDISAVKHNLNEIRSKIGENVAVMPILKANAYGCGADIIANIMRECEFMAVADSKEAVMFREAYEKANILILYQPAYHEIDAIIENDFITAACDINFIRELNERAILAGKKVKIHVEIDTGASRLGVFPDDVSKFMKEVAELKNIILHGIFMHFCVADSENDSDIEFTKLQTERFKLAISAAENVIAEIPYKHACSGSAIFTAPYAHFNMVRPGYMMYGYYSDESLKRKIDLIPALKLSTKILYIKTVPSGTSVSYGRTFTTKRETKIATVAIGYSDGISRRLSNKGYFAVNGQRAPIIGRICMDLTMLDITDISGEINVGDSVFVFDNTNVTVDEIARLCDTIGYEVIARIEDKAERVEGF